MTNFLEGLVLRAAGLPPSAAPAPRTAPAGESLEPENTIEEMIEERRDAPRSIDVRPERERVVMRESMPAETPRPPEHIVEVRQSPVPAPVVVRERPVEPARPADERFHEEDVETAREALITPPPSAPPLVSPPVRQIEAPHGQALSPMPAHGDEPIPALVTEPPRSSAAPAVDEREPRETPQPAPPTMVVQPIVLDRTRTIVEPVREERVVETERQVFVTPQPLTTPSPLATPPREEAPEPRTDITPAPQLSESEKTAQPSPERDSPRLIDDEPSAPQTLVLPAIMPDSATAPLFPLPHPPTPPVSVRIGTIEIRAAAPPPPPPAPAAPAAPPPEPDFRSGFDDYARIRRHTPPEAW